MVWLLLPRPEPLHTGHGSSTSIPRPLQSRQGSPMANPPAFELVYPVPVQVGHTRGTVPALAPVPPQALHGEALVIFSGTVTPSTACSKVMVAFDSTSAPRRAAVRVRPPGRPPPNRPPSTSPIPPPEVPVWPVLNRSPRSKENPPSGPVVVVVPPRCPKPPPPNSERAWSYSLRLLGSERTECASETSLNRASAFGSSLLWSGWSSRANLR